MVKAIKWYLFEILFNLQKVFEQIIEKDILTLLIL